MASTQPAPSPVSPVAEAVEREEWNPTEEAVALMRGRHRLPKQSAISRGSTVFGVAAIAVVGAGGAATASSGVSPVPISMPDLPELSDMPGLGGLVSSDEEEEAPTAAAAPTRTEAAPQVVAADAGEALRARLVAQATAQQEAAETAAREKAERAAAEEAAKEAAAQKVRDEAAAKKAEEEAEKKAAEAAAAKAEAERLAQLAASFVKPLSSYTLSSGFGESGSMWSSTHTGQDFAAPSGTPVVAVHSGTITEAGWAGSYGYRIILTLDDGTEIWYCHLSSMVKTGGEVTTGETIGRVGSTGNSTGPHLHLEVRPGGGDPISPMTWLRDHDVTV